MDSLILLGAAAALAGAVSDLLDGLTDSGDGETVAIAVFTRDDRPWWRRLLDRMLGKQRRVVQVIMTSDDDRQ